jgi:AhpD family alkylhydroperoxidase
MNQKVTQAQVLEQVKATYGFVPNLMAVMAEHNPAVAQAYLAVSGALEGGALAATERQVVMLAVSAFNDCHYCTAVHRTVARSMGVDQATLDAVDALSAPADARLKTLVEATWTLLRERSRANSGPTGPGSLSVSELFELSGVIGMKTISNTINRVVQTEIDEPFRAQATRTAAGRASR